MITTLWIGNPPEAEHAFADDDSSCDHSIGYCECGNDEPCGCGAIEHDEECAVLYGHPCDCDPII